MTLVVSDDYPDMYQVLEKDEMSMVSGPVVDVVDTFCMKRARRVGVPYIGRLVRGSTADSVFSTEMYSDSEMEMTIESSSDNEEEEEERGGWNPGCAWVAGSRSGARFGKKLLDHDINIYEQVVGGNAAGITSFEGIDLVHIRMDWNPPLTSMTGKAWGVDVRVPVRIVFETTLAWYASGLTPPEFTLSQDSSIPFLLRFQLQNILQTFLRDHWEVIRNRLAHRPVVPSIDLTGDDDDDRTIHSASQEGSSQKQPSAEEVARDQIAPGATKSIAQAEEELTMAALALTEMNFPFEHAIHALYKVATVEEAAGILLDDLESLAYMSEGATPEPGSFAFRLLEESGQSSTTTSSTTTAEMEITSTGMSSSSSNQAGPSSSGGIVASSDGDVFDIDALDFEHGFLALVRSFLNMRTPSLNTRCIICDQAHLFGAGFMLKPSVCTRALCCFAYQELGLAADAAAEIALGTAIIDLMVSVAIVAARSNRADVIFDPYPRMFDPENRSELVLNPDEKDFVMLGSILDAFPPVSVMAGAADAASLTEMMNETNRFAYPLLSWIISSNRSHIVMLPEEHRLPIKTPFQYLMLSSAPDKEAEFQRLKSLHGSKFAFHGSETANWFSILRNGLKNATGTKLQRNGAAHGAGCYLSTTLSYSINYSTKHQRNQGRGSRVAASTADPENIADRFLDPSNMICVALCELIDIDVRKSNNIWVVPNEAHVATRFLFVFSQAQAIEYDTRPSIDPSFHAEVVAVLDAQMNG